MEPMQGRQLSDEQLAVVHSNARRLKVNAGAGTGKTFTLGELARSRPRESILYATFSKAAQTDAAERLPPNVLAKTLASLAYPSHGRSLNAHRKLQATVRAASVAHLFPEDDPARSLLRGRFALEAIREFCYATAASIEPSESVCAAAAKAGLSTGRVGDDARRLWRQMFDLSDRMTPVTHDAYFKAWSLDGAPGLAGSADRYLVDEAQDNNAAADALFAELRQPVAYVGDSAQSIYAFRGAVDSLSTFQADETLSLRTSYRFGTSIAALANALLERFKIDPLRMVGLGGQDAITSVESDLPLTIIARTNAGVFASALAALERGHAIDFVGGFDSYNFARLVDLSAVCAGRPRQCRDPLLRTLGSMQAVDAYAKLTEDQDLKSALRLVRDAGSQIAHLVERLKVATLSQTEGDGKSLVSLSTAHRVKGLEFGQVMMADDFPDIYMPNGELVPIDKACQQEINLLYVTVTRATTIFQPNPSLVRLALSLEQRSGPSSAPAACASAQRTRVSGQSLDTVA